MPTSTSRLENEEGLEVLSRVDDSIPCVMLPLIAMEMKGGLPSLSSTVPFCCEDEGLYDMTIYKLSKKSILSN